MIDIVQSPEPNLKNIQQIGSPDEKDKVYIAQSAYTRIHQEEFPDKRVFVLMGHTECTDTRYATFVEGTIPVREIEFTQNVPKWTNRCWNEVFKEIKRSYESSIIVGWALDIKGMPPKSSQELEMVHREQFGGAHQVLMLLDTLEQEEYFYINKKNHLRQKSGFYVYGQPQSTPVQLSMDLELEPPTLDRGVMHRNRQSTLEAYGKDNRQKDAISRKEKEAEVTPRYRESLLQKQNHADKPPQKNSYAMAAAMVLLIAIVGVTAYRTSHPAIGSDGVLPAMSSQQENTQASKEPAQNQADNTETMIPVEEIAGSLTPESGVVAPGNSESPVSQPPGSENSQSESQQDAPAEPTDIQAPVATQSYIVKQGDTLASICRAHYQGLGNVSKICALNGITDPNQIYVGQELQLP